ncbi:unnamed protein product [Brassicogethes aeneus]|uniref:Nuclear pore protein n=1 Tax=Brassicogethes aeneus TaxID=1431903 RepID=A0A9P0B535_BRAAE|nr:unnamed protein product [Brassicogethes aeneus]
MSDFSELLQEAEKLTSDLEGTAELPKVDRSLRQVLEASNDLYTRVAQTGAKDIQANLLLGSKGIDLPKIVQKLESISTKRTFEPIEPIEDLDIPGTLENEIRNRILSAFDTGFNDMLNCAYNYAWEHQSGEWKQEKRKILYAMGGHSGGLIENVKPLSIMHERSFSTAPNLGPIETIYFAKVKEYNTSVKRDLQKPNLVDIFLKVANEFKDAKVKDMWEIIRYMTQTPSFPQSEDAIKTRYSKLYVNALVKQGKKYLEDRYKTYMSNIINENLSQAARGGVPGTYPLVRSFVGLRLQGEYIGLKDGRIDDRPLWPMVYYCLRSGDITAAIYCLKRSNTSEFDDLITLLEAKLSNSSADLSKLEDNLRFHYRRFIRNETDPFKRIIWAVLSCCDVTDEHSEVARTADDYLWLKLSLVRVDYDKDDFIKYADLQYTILEEYGESHYDAFNQPHLYFQVLALTGQFEAAIEFLSRIDKYRVHSVHMAIALNELYSLGGPQDTGAPLISIDPCDDRPARRLNLARLIMLYVRKFELSCLDEALHYFFLLRNFNNFEGVNLFKLCVSDLCLETKQYDAILGTVQNSGIRVKGLADQFTTPSISTESIAEIIGNNLLKKGLYEEAIDIFDIANKQEEVLNLLCAMLSQVVHLQGEDGSLRNRLQQKTRVFRERFLREGYKAGSTKLVTSFLKLSELLMFFDQYHGKLFPQAIKTLNELQIVPLQEADVDERIKSFKNLNDDLCKVIPDILLATMNMLFAQYQKLKGSEYIPRYNDSGIDKQLSNLRNQAKTLTSFAGMLPYRMPGDTNSRLVQMEILMH